MKISKVETKKELECPAIVKIADDYYLVSKKYFPITFSEKGTERYIAINLNDGKWFDWGDKIPEFEPEMETYPKGTTFEIKI